MAGNKTSSQWKWQKEKICWKKTNEDGESQRNRNARVEFMTPRVSAYSHLSPSPLRPAQRASRCQPGMFPHLSGSFIKLLRRVRVWLPLTCDHAGSRTCSSHGYLVSVCCSGKHTFCISAKHQQKAFPVWILECAASSFVKQLLHRETSLQLTIKFNLIAIWFAYNQTVWSFQDGATYYFQ